MAKADKNPLTQELINVVDQLEARYGRRKLQQQPDFIEALLFQILDLGASEKASREAMVRLRTEYVDWNDMRVASVREIEDILGARYPDVRNKAEDVKAALAALYTAFRKLELDASTIAPESVETLRALPDYTTIRRDMVDRALIMALGLKGFPCDDDQFRQLKFLGGVPKHANLQNFLKKIEEALEIEDLLRLSRVLREHVQVWRTAGEDDPQPVDFGLKKESAKKDKTTKRVAKK
jgi:endonuclease III